MPIRFVNRDQGLFNGYQGNHHDEIIKCTCIVLLRSCNYIEEWHESQNHASFPHAISRLRHHHVNNAIYSYSIIASWWRHHIDIFPSTGSFFRESNLSPRSCDLHSSVLKISPIWPIVTFVRWTGHLEASAFGQNGQCGLNWNQGL